MTGQQEPVQNQNQRAYVYQNLHTLTESEDMAVNEEVRVTFVLTCCQCLLMLASAFDAL